MFRKVLSATIIGVDVSTIYVEADVSDGLPNFTMIGYLTSQVKEAQDRVRTAFRNIHIVLPPKRITINMAPADIRKDGSRFDLPIAMAILGALDKISSHKLSSTLIIGELSLNGEVNAVTGVLPIVIHAKKIGCTSCVIPKGNLREAKIIQGLDIIGVSSLKEALEYFQNGVKPQEEEQKIKASSLNYNVDFEDIHGQEAVKRAAFISVCGFHNLLLVGPPGSGKTMIAKRIPTILPQLTIEQSLEISKIYSIAGLLSFEHPLISYRPFRSPHHTVSPQALAGGGYIPTPGEITLAHGGVLFLDEMPEFSKRSLEILRQPMEDREIQIARTSGNYSFPANFLLVAAMNPCKCGYYPDMNRCNCSPSDVSRYINKISQPLLDRIDITIEAPQVTYQELIEKKGEGENSASIREKVAQVHKIQERRYKQLGIQFNSELTVKTIDEFCPMTQEAKQLLRKTFEKMELSARAYHRIIKVARTIADIENESIIQVKHLTEAICYRTLDKKYWG